MKLATKVVAATKNSARDRRSSSRQRPKSSSAQPTSSSKAATAAMKVTMGSIKSILPTDFPSLGVPWLIEAATALYGKAKVADRIPQVANVVISNVPGPPVPLYMAGAKMITNYPTSIIVHGMALNITVQSYDKSLDFGLMADAAAMPDVRELADAIAIAFDDLRALPRPGDADSDEALPDGPVARTARQLGGRVARAMTGAVTGAVSTAMKGAVKGAVTGAVTGAVKQALGQVTRSAAAAAVPKATRQRVAEPRATAPVRRRKAG